MFKHLDEPYRSVFPFTQVHPIRQQNLVTLGRAIVEENVPGVIVECGVLDGGTATLMAWASRKADPTRRVLKMGLKRPFGRGRWSAVRLA
jgi:hypothetical protein